MKYQSSNNSNSNSTGTPRNENATQKLIRENVDFLIEQLEAGRSGALTTYLTAMSHFHNYSFGNILQIARQKAIITEGTEKGELRKICADPNCPVHHPKKQKPVADANWKAEQEKQHREEALAQATGLRVLNAIIAAVPVRLMKRDLLFIVERVATILDERRLEVVTRNRGIKKAKESDSTPKLLNTYIRKSDEGELGRLLMEMVILHAARTQQDGGRVLKEAAEHYKVDTDAIALKVKQEFTAKEKARIANKSNPKKSTKAAKKSTAA